MISARPTGRLSVCSKNFNVAIFSGTINMINVKLVVVLVPALHIQTTFSDFESTSRRSNPIKIEICTIVDYLKYVMNILFFFFFSYMFRWDNWRISLFEKHFNLAFSRTLLKRDLSIFARLLPCPESTFSLQVWWPSFVSRSQVCQKHKLKNCALLDCCLNVVWY